VTVQVPPQQTLARALSLGCASLVPLTHDGLVVQQVHGALDGDRSRDAPAGRLDRTHDRRREIADPPRADHFFDVRSQEGRLVDVLKRPTPLQGGGRGAYQQNDGRLREPGVLDGRDGIGGTGPRCYRRDADLPAETRDGIRREDRGRFVPHVDHANPSALAADENR
jgi:hypothetical protein